MRDMPSDPAQDLQNPRPFRPKTLQWWHDSIIDWMLVNPDKNKKDCAAYFNVTPEYIRQLTNSDVFRARLVARRQVLEDRLNIGIVERIQSLACTSLDVLHERIAEERKTIGLEAVRETADMALKALGYTAPKGGSAPAAAPGSNVVNIQLVIDKRDLEESRRLMRTVEAERLPEPEGEPDELDRALPAPA